MELQEAMEQLARSRGKGNIAEETLKILQDNSEQAISIIHTAMEDMQASRSQLMRQDHSLCLSGLVLLQKLHDPQTFEYAMDMALLPARSYFPSMTEFAFTRLKDILYLSFDGDFSRLEQGILDTRAADAGRGAMLSALFQLYQDGKYGKSEMTRLADALADQARDELHAGFTFSSVYTMLVYNITLMRRQELSLIALRLFEMGAVEKPVITREKMLERMSDTRYEPKRSCAAQLN